MKSCETCTNGKRRDGYGYELWVCSKYSEVRANKCRLDGFKEWEGEDDENNNISDAPQGTI